MSKLKKLKGKPLNSSHFNRFIGHNIYIGIQNNIGHDIKLDIYLIKLLKNLN